MGNYIKELITPFKYVESKRAEIVTDRTKLVSRTLLRRLGNFAFHQYGIEDLNPDGQAFSKSPPKNILVVREFTDFDTGEKYISDALAISVGTVVVFYVQLANDTSEVVLAALRDLVTNGIDKFMPQLVQEHDRQSKNALVKPETKEGAIAANSKMSAQVAESSR